MPRTLTRPGGRARRWAAGRALDLHVGRRASRGRSHVEHSDRRCPGRGGDHGGARPRLRPPTRATSPASRLPVSSGGRKCLQLLKEAVPNIKRVGVLLNPLNPIWHGYPEVMNDAARVLGLELVRVEAQGADDVDEAFAAMSAQGVDALFGLTDATLIGASRRRRGSWSCCKPSPAGRIGRASLCPRRRPFVGCRGLSGPPRGAAEYIDRILQGAKVAELPVVLPSKYMLPSTSRPRSSSASRSRPQSSCAPTR